MSIIENKLRNGNYTSSCVWKLLTVDKKGTGFGVPALTYIKERNYERNIKRSLSLDKYNHSTLWGHFLEKRVHNLLGIDYESVGHITVQHPTISYWCGSPDNKNVSKSICGDTKCYQPKAFCQYVDTLKEANGDTEIFKKEYPQEYWQLVSNAIILGMDNIEAIVYMPYYSELEEIAELVDDMDVQLKWKYKFIYDCIMDEDRRIELPFLPNDSTYKNLNRFVFKIPEADKELLTSTIIKAGRYLI